MKFSYQTLLSGLTFALKRLWRHRGLVFCLFVGLTLAVALAVAVPLYADGVNYHLLNSALNQAASESHRPPFNFIFHYVGSWHKPLTIDQFNPINQFMEDPVSNLIGLPNNGLTRYVTTDNLQLYPNGENIQRSKRLELVKLAFVSGLLETGQTSPIQLIEGRLPEPVNESGKAIEALVSLKLANDLGLQVGMTYLLYRPGQVGSPAFQQPVIVTGIWTPLNPTDTFWFYPPESLDKKLLIPEETFFGPVAGNLAQPINEALWRFDFDGSRIHSEDVPELIGRIEQVQTKVNALLPYTDLETSRHRFCASITRIPSR
jgi:putative ABC transport system permease protein